MSFYCCLYFIPVQSSSSDSRVLIVAVTYPQSQCSSHTYFVGARNLPRNSEIQRSSVFHAFSTRMLLTVRDRVVIANSKMNSSVNLWFLFSAEFFIGAAFTAIFVLLNVVKSFLPKPPRDLTGDVVLIAGVSSTFGESLAEEFMENGCSVICLDNDLRSVEGIITRLKSRYRRSKKIRLHHKKRETQDTAPTLATYECDFLNYNTIRSIVRKIKNEVGGIDMLVTCVEQPNENVFDTTIMNIKVNYWMALAFLPYMLQRDRAHIVGITSNTFDRDGYLFMTGIFGLMESLGHELRGCNSHLTVLSISLKTGHSATKQQSVRQAVKEAVQAIRRDQCSIRNNWILEILYRVSCVTYNAITAATQWLHAERCDYSF